jgi:uncharacterized FlgJ-related protein
MLYEKLKNVSAMLKDLFSKESRMKLTRELFSRSNRTRLYIIGSLLVIAFAAGTFWPNWAVKKKVALSATDTLKNRARSFGLVEPLMHYYNQKTFIEAVSKCVDYLNFEYDSEQEIPKAIIIAMAMIESDNGSSRFALEGNALFGVRTWDANQPQLKAYKNLNAKWGVKKYPTKCASVRDMIHILNTKTVHREFQRERSIQRILGIKNVYRLAGSINSWATNPEYSNEIKEVIRDNGLDKLN